MKSFLTGLLGLSLFISNILAQGNDYYISGFITDAITGEALVGTNILLYRDSLSLKDPPLSGTATNKFGYYVIPSIKNGTYLLIIRHLGYKTHLAEIFISGDLESETFSIELFPEDIELEEIIVEGERKKETITSTVDISPDLLSKLPTLTGEIDLFKSLEFLPGVNKPSEISSGLYVRGGSPDQTLTLVDGVIVYNPAHLGNIASTFNTSAISDVRLIKGAYPAEYGGRLSSVLDIKLRSGTKEKEKGTVGLGLINSYAGFEGPIGESSTYMISGRVMYYDMIQRNFNNTSTIPRYNFYDLSGKVNYILSGSSIVSISALFSRDNAYSPPEVTDTDYEIEWKNVNLSLNWIQVNKKSLLLNTIASFINYEFSSKIGVSPNTVSSYTYFSNPDISDFYFRQNAELRWLQDHTFKTGFDIAVHNYDLLYSDIYVESLDKNPFAGRDITSVEASLYFQSESQFTEEISANLGGRFYYFDNQKLFRFEPRLSASYNVSDNIALKGAFSIAHQFLHLVVRNDITLPTDLWYPSTGKIQPAKSSQYVLGFESYWLNQTYLFTIEGFYKELKNIYEFRNAPQLNPLDNSIEDQFTSGQGESYGIEFFINKRKGRFSGWIGYTLSWSVRQFDELNGGRKFYSKYDRRHDFSIVLSYRLLENLNAGLTWVYASGERYTLPPGQYIFDPLGTTGSSQIQFNYTGLNTAQFPDYHKMDLNFNYSFRMFNSSFEAYVNLYNIYNRNNAFARYIVLQENNDGEQVPVIKQITLFPFIPSVGISVKF